MITSLQRAPHTFSLPLSGSVVFSRRTTSV